MTTARAYTIACATTLPVLVAVAAIRLDASTAWATAIAGAVLLANLVLSERAHQRFVMAAAADNDRSAAQGLVAQHAMVLPIAAVLVLTLGAVPTALASVQLMAGALVFAAGQAIRAADVRHVVQRPLETT